MLFSVTVVQMNEANQPVTQELTMNSDEVFFVFRPPLQQETVYSTSVGMIKAVSAIPDELLKVLIKFDTPDGAPLYANAKRIVLTHSPQLGIQVIVFPGGAQAILKEPAAIVQDAILGKTVPLQVVSKILMG